MKVKINVVVIFLILSSYLHAEDAAWGTLQGQVRAFFYA